MLLFLIKAITLFGFAIGVGYLISPTVYGMVAGFTVMCGIQLAIEIGEGVAARRRKK